MATTVKDHLIDFAVDIGQLADRADLTTKKDFTDELEQLVDQYDEKIKRVREKRNGR